MIYALVHYPAIYTKRINVLRNKYDPQFNLIEPHITVIFPVTHSIGERNLVVHIEGVLNHWKPFTVRLCGLEMSPDNYLFLLLREGAEEVKHLQAELYTGVLASYRNNEVPFVPHLTLGRFIDNLQSYDSALKEAEEMDFDYECLFDRVHLVKVDDERKRLVWTKEFLM